MSPPPIERTPSNASLEALRERVAANPPTFQGITPSPFPDRPVTYTTSGSAAFEAIVRAFELDGSRMMVPAFLCTGAFPTIFDHHDIEPHFVDVHPSTYLLDIRQARAELHTVDAVLVDHAFGQPAPGRSWRALCDRHDVFLIEDCARALGGTADGRPAGGWGDAAIYSFAKTTPLSRGGAIAADHPISLDPNPISSEGMLRAAYDAVPDGSRLAERYSAYRAADGGSRSEDRPPVPVALDALTRWRFERYVRRRYVTDRNRMRKVERILREMLPDYGFGIPPQAGETHLQTRAPGDREHVVTHLRSQGYPVHAVWREPWGLEHGDFPVTETLSDTVLTFRLREWSPQLAAELESDLARLVG